MKKIFLLIGLLASFAAFALVVSKVKKSKVYDVPDWYKSDMHYDKQIREAAFSPDGEYLAFTVLDESGEIQRTSTYLYSLSFERLETLNTNSHGWISNLQWAADSRRFIFDQEGRIGLLFKGCLFNIETNAVEREFGGFVSNISPSGKWVTIGNEITQEAFLQKLDAPISIPFKFTESFLYWNKKSDSLVFVDSSRKMIMQYDFNRKALNPVTSPFDQGIHVRLFPDPNLRDDGFYFLTPRNQHGSAIRPVAIWRLDLESGKVVEILDSELDPLESWIATVYPRMGGDSLLYMESGTKEEKSLVDYNLSTKTEKLLLRGKFRLYAYSAPKSIFALSIADDGYKILYLFDSQTGIKSQIFPEFDKKKS